VSDGAAVPPALPEPVATPAVSGRLSLATRTGLLTAGVAALTVLISGLLAYPLVRQESATQVQANLAQQADVIAGLLGSRQQGERADDELRDQVRALDRQGITGYVLSRESQPIPPVTANDIAALAAGNSVSATRERDGLSVFLEGRPLQRGRAVVLIQKAQVASDAAVTLLRRMMFAFALGLVLAALIGWLASRRITRTLRDAAVAAERIGAGDRNVRLGVKGPTEVADIADSLNRLSSALAVSENRQRAFLLSVSHELRTPLTAVKGYAEALKDGVVPSDDVARTGGIVLSESARLERLVSDLLDLGRSGAVDFQLNLVNVDLRDFARDAGQVWSDRCSREGVIFVLEEPVESTTVTTDPLRLRQVVDNLAENALRVTPAGAPIVLAVRDADSSVVVEVRDGGPGLTEADLPVAFLPEELFSRYRGIRQVGTGIGLALVGSLAARLGGVAEAGHAPEGGARFTVTIPKNPA